MANEQLESFLKGETATVTEKTPPEAPPAAPEPPPEAAAPKPEAKAEPTPKAATAKSEPDDDGPPPKALEGEDVIPLRAYRATLDLLILADSENGTGPTDISLATLAAERGGHPSDALADWVLANGIGSRYLKQNSTTVPMTDDDRRTQVVNDAQNPLALMGGTDAGAHLTMFCGADSNLHLITHWARDDVRSRWSRPSTASPSVSRLLRSADRVWSSPADGATRGVRARRARDPRSRTALRPARRSLPIQPSARRVPRVAVAGELTVADGESTGTLRRGSAHWPRSRPRTER